VIGQFFTLEPVALLIYPTRQSACQPVCHGPVLWRRCLHPCRACRLPSLWLRLDKQFHSPLKKLLPRGRFIVSDAIARLSVFQSTFDLDAGHKSQCLEILFLELFFRFAKPDGCIAIILSAGLLAGAIFSTSLRRGSSAGERRWHDECVENFSRRLAHSGALVHDGRAEITAMIEDEIRARMTQRLLAAQTPWGRWRLNAYAGWKSFLWKTVVGATLFVKRALDMVVSLMALIVLLPVLLFMAALVKLDGGPIFCRQTRVGLRGREFKLLKYRTVTVDAEAQMKDMPAPSGQRRGVISKMGDAPFVTPVGKVLHRTAMDELPQFLNVLKGEMSLVGPRAPVPREVAHYSQADRRRLTVKPGMTCLWQVEAAGEDWRGIGNAGVMKFSREVSLDVRYIESQSFWLDLVILAKTVPAVLLGRGL